jgi:hypothetical protein
MAMEVTQGVRGEIHTRLASEGNQLYPIENQDKMLASTVEFRYFICTGYNKMHAELGTKFDEHHILTHNHFGKQANFCIFNPSMPGLTHDIAIKEGSRAIGHGDEYGDQTRIVSIVEENEGPFVPIVPMQLILGLTEGEFVEVVYWDDIHSKLAITRLQIRGFLGDSVLVLGDPDDIINKGDSGGGVFYQGTLIGNTWRYIENSEGSGNMVDKKVHVHIVPSEIDKTLSNW